MLLLLLLPAAHCCCMVAGGTLHCRIVVGWTAAAHHRAPYVAPYDVCRGLYCQNCFLLYVFWQSSAPR
jgi:hypothetical protein